MKRKLIYVSKSILALRSFATMLLFISAISVGWGTNYIHWGESGIGGWSDAELSGSGSTETTTITLTAEKNYEFVLKKGDNTWWKFNGTVEVKSGTEYSLSTSNGQNGKISNAAGGTYTFKVVWNNGNPTLTVTFPSTSGGGAESNYKLMLKTNNTTGSEPGTEVATFTGSNFPYTATYNITQAGPYYFYVNDGTKDYLNGAKLTFENGSDVTIYKYESTNNQYDHAVTLNAQTTGTYTFTFNQSGSDYTLRCDYPASTSSDAYYLPNSGNNNFERNDNCKFVDGTLTLNLTAGFTFKVCKKTGSSENWYSDGSTISATTTGKSITSNADDNMTLTVTQPGTYTFKVEDISNGVKLSVTYPTSTHNVSVTDGPGGTVTPTEPLTVGTGAVSITATANDGYVFEKWTASSTGIKIADAYKASTTFTATASGTVTANFTAKSSKPIYYVVFPDDNVGNTARADKTVTNIPTGHTAFRLIPSRNRNANTLDEDLVSINLKIDGDKGRQLRYDTNGKIKFYITDGSGNYFKTDALTSANDNLQATGKTANNGVDCYDTRSGSVSSGKPGHYYTIQQSDAAKTKSLTFMFSNNNKSDKYYIFNSGESAKQLDPAQPSNSVDGFGSGIKSGNLIVGFLTSRGYGSDYYNDHISNGVYLVGQMDGKSYTHNKNYKMKKILYPLGTNDEAQADSIVYSCTVKKGSADWDDFFLSFSTGDKVEDGNNLWNLLLRPNVQNQMDGQALEGGVTFFKNDNGTDNAQQALNPLLSDAQKNRYVSYTIYFNATYSTYRIEFHDGFYIAGEALEESGSYEPAKRIAMSKADLNGVEHYIYTGKFIQGGKFAFFLNEDSYALNYCEDNNAVTYDEETSKTAWDVQAPANGADYAFYNRVLYNTTGSDGNLGTDKNGMVWGLPTGTYTIRFYNHAEKENNNQLYTVDKEVLMANVTSTFKESEATSETVHNYGGWRTLSDDCALLLPNGVKAYYAANVGNGKVYLKELTDGYIPAHCPVILSNPNLLAGTKNIAFPVRPDGYDIQQTLADGEQNYLVDCYEKAGTVSPEVTVNGTPKYNYFFSYRFKFAGKEMSDVPLGFWKPFAGTATKKNYSYLSVDKELYPSEYENYNFTYNEGETVVSTKAYCFVMAFDEDELGDNTTTGIEQVKENAEVDMTNAVWHNMQGVRIRKPSAPGMYICNGKKVVVR